MDVAGGSAVLGTNLEVVTFGSHNGHPHPGLNFRNDDRIAIWLAPNWCKSSDPICPHRCHDDVYGLPGAARLLALA